MNGRGEVGQTPHHARPRWARRESTGLKTVNLYTHFELAELIGAYMRGKRIVETLGEEKLSRTLLAYYRRVFPVDYETRSWENRHTLASEERRTSHESHRYHRREGGGRHRRRLSSLNVKGGESLFVARDRRVRSREVRNRGELACTVKTRYPGNVRQDQRGKAPEPRRRARINGEHWPGRKRTSNKGNHSSDRSRPKGGRPRRRDKTPCGSEPIRTETAPTKEPSTEIGSGEKKEKRTRRDEETLRFENSSPPSAKKPVPIDDTRTGSRKNLGEERDLTAIYLGSTSAS